MGKTAKEIIDEIEAHIDKRGGAYEDWYVGVTDSPRDRLFEDHDVDEDNDAWIYVPGETEDDVREAERHFVEDQGTDGDTGGGEDVTDTYAYKKQRHTDP